jgi:hypothetical protein
VLTAFLQRFVSFLHAAGDPSTTAKIQWAEQLGQVRSRDLHPPKSAKHLMWFHFEPLGQDIEGLSERTCECPVHQAPELPDVIVTFLVIWLQARKSGLWMPSGFDKSNHSVGEAAALMCSFAAHYRAYFTVTIWPIANLYLLLWTADGAAASLPPAVRRFFSLKDTYRCPISLDDLHSYDVILFPSILHVKVNIPGHCKSNQESMARITELKLKVWPSFELETPFEMKEVLYGVDGLASWDGFNDHSLPTSIIAAGGKEEMAQTIQSSLARLTSEAARRGFSTANGPLADDARSNTVLFCMFPRAHCSGGSFCSGYFVIKSTEGYASIGFSVGTDAASLADKAVTFHAVLGGHGFLIQPFSPALKKREYRIFLHPFTGSIDAVIATSDDEGMMAFEDVTESVTGTRVPGDSSDAPKLAAFAALVVSNAKVVQRHLLEGIATRLDCFVDPSTGKVLLNEVTTGLDCMLFLSSRSARCLFRYTALLFSHVARFAHF